MKVKIIVCMKDEKYLRSLEKFIVSKVRSEERRVGKECR